MDKVTIFVPCYNESASLPYLYNALREIMDSNPNFIWELLLVNDGSEDYTIDVIKHLRKIDKRVSYIPIIHSIIKVN